MGRDPGSRADSQAWTVDPPFDHAALSQALYEDNAFPYLRLMGTALRRLELVEGMDLVWTYLTQSDLQEAGVHPAETDDLIDVIRQHGFVAASRYETVAQVMLGLEPDLPLLHF